MHRSMPMHTLFKIRTTLRVYCIIYKRSITLGNCRRISHVYKCELWVVYIGTNCEARDFVQGLNYYNLPVPTDIPIVEYGPTNI